MTLRRLVDQGVLSERRTRILVLIPVTHFPVADRSRVEEFRRRVVATLTQTEPVDTPETRR